jgi:putative membrane protein
MSQPLFRKSALAAALVSLGLAVGVSAQTSQQPSGGTAATPAPPAAGSTGMDRGAGSATSKGATPAPSTGSASAGKAAPAALSGGERRFLENAARGGMAEVELGKLAQQKGESQQVKDFGKRMVDDHGKANEELKRIAGAKGVTLPTEVDGKHKRLIDKLSKKSGHDFDREYMDEMVDDHEKDVKDFRSMAKSAKDADVKSFASSTLPTLEQHLQAAKSTEDAVKQAGRKSTTKQAGSTRDTTASRPAGTTSAAGGGTGASTATPGKNTAATTGTAGPGTGMPASSNQATGTAPQAPGGPADTRSTSPQK